MRIREFLETANGKRFVESLRGCSRNWLVEYFESKEDFIETLLVNGWDPEEAEEEFKAADLYYPESGEGFVEVIN